MQITNIVVSDDNFERSVAEASEALARGENVACTFKGLAEVERDAFNDRVMACAKARGLDVGNLRVKSADKGRLEEFKNAIANSDIIVGQMPEGAIVLTDDNFHSALQDVVAKFESGVPVHTDLTDLSDNLKDVLRQTMEDAASDKGGELDHRMALVVDTGSSPEDVAAWFNPDQEPLYYDAPAPEDTTEEELQAEFREEAGKIVAQELADYDLTIKVNAEMFGSALYTMLQMRPEWNTRHHITEIIERALRTASTQVVGVIEDHEKDLATLRADYFGDILIAIDDSDLDLEEADRCFSKVANDETTDGHEWAVAFMGVLARASEDDFKLDIDLMRAWFANAIERGRAAGLSASLDAVIDARKAVAHARELVARSIVQDPPSSPFAPHRGIGADWDGPTPFTEPSKG